MTLPMIHPSSQIKLKIRSKNYHSKKSLISTHLKQQRRRTTPLHKLSHTPKRNRASNWPFQTTASRTHRHAQPCPSPATARVCRWTSPTLARSCRQCPSRRTRRTRRGGGRRRRSAQSASSLSGFGSTKRREPNSLKTPSTPAELCLEAHHAVSSADTALSGPSSNIHPFRSTSACSSPRRFLSSPRSPSAPHTFSAQPLPPSARTPSPPAPPNMTRHQTIQTPAARVRITATRNPTVIQTRRPRPRLTLLRRTATATATVAPTPLIDHVPGRKNILLKISVFPFLFGSVVSEFSTKFITFSVQFG
ncbi:hypothetical protein BLNAU_5703 [Blattamonas nauphoetae]|uniref:Uncharacterized protein n=1 Tax=Blattamonas nauphoetae TaxID=2049346 RepID=A0ABQ9Y6V8_9EUKA|nr:hypothetical protein BLNAU_5703 [Blattamonas nauphoetae]